MENVVKHESGLTTIVAGVYAGRAAAFCLALEVLGYLGGLELSGTSDALRVASFVAGTLMWPLSTGSVPLSGTTRGALVTASALVAGTLSVLAIVR